MRSIKLGLAALAVGALVGTAALAQTGQMGPAKTPNGSMPAAPSNSTASQGSSMATDGSMMQKKPMKKMSKKRMKRSKMM